MILNIQTVNTTYFQGMNKMDGLSVVKKQGHRYICATIIFQCPIAGSVYQRDFIIDKGLFLNLIYSHNSVRYCHPFYSWETRYSKNVLQMAMAKSCNKTKTSKKAIQAKIYFHSVKDSTKNKLSFNLSSQFTVFGFSPSFPANLSIFFHPMNST